MKKILTPQFAARAAALLLILAGLGWILSLFIHPGGRAYTNNAQVRQDIVAVNARVQGYVNEVRFSDFQPVHKGDTLLLIEDAEFRLRLAQAESGYLSALAGKSAHGTSIATTRSNATVNDARLEELRVRLANSEKEYNRYRNMLAQQSVTQQQFDAVETQYNALRAQYDALQSQQHSTLLTVDEQTQRLDQSTAAIAVAKAQLELERLNLSYTVITAPCDGYTSRCDIKAGELLHPGQQMLSVVDGSQRWVMANFRERQMRHIALGSKVSIQVDALPRQRFEGEVVAIAPASGEQYSAVPHDNATGNFVKVEQRIPVRIAFCEGQDLSALKAGMNVEVKVK